MVVSKKKIDVKKSDKSSNKARDSDDSIKNSENSDNSTKEIGVATATTRQFYLRYWTISSSNLIDLFPIRISLWLKKSSKNTEILIVYCTVT